MEETKIQLLSYQPVKYSKVVVNGLINEEEAKIYDITKNPKNFDKSQLSELKRCQYNEDKDSASEYHWLVFGLGKKAEKPNKIYHGWKPISKEEYEQMHQLHGYTKFYGLDYGFANPTACVEVMYNGDDTFYIRPLLYKPMNAMTSPLGEILKSIGVPSGNVTFIWADSADREPGTELSLTNDLRKEYSLNAVPTKKPSYKARFEFISKARIFYVENGEFENEYENYEYEYINNAPTEKPIKKNDHYMNALEYAIYGIKEYYNVVF